MIDLSKGILEPPIPPPRIVEQTNRRRYARDPDTGKGLVDKNGRPIETKTPLCHRKLVKGKIRSAGFPYVSPCKEKGRESHFRVRYSRRKVKFSRVFKSRLMCGYVAQLIRQAEDPDLWARMRDPLIDPLNLIAHAHDEHHGGFLWIHETEVPTIIKISPNSFEAVGDVPWFWMKGKMSPVCPVVKVDPYDPNMPKGQFRRVHLTWRDLWDDVWVRPRAEFTSKDSRPTRNPAGQYVHDWSPWNVTPKIIIMSK
ncbi:MAG: hypothetical protein P1U86_05790 [Verrucomicrobiales bacterium]|nr:hypothetical protein [Verrucomicrobiales bacterium]